MEVGRHPRVEEEVAAVAVLLKLAWAAEVVEEERNLQKTVVEAVAADLNLLVVEGQRVYLAEVRAVRCSDLEEAVG